MKIPGIERVALLGLGLMGASLGRTLKRRKFKGCIYGYARREETRVAAIERGMVDAIADNPREAVAGADLVVLCTPILAIPALVEEISASLKPGCIVTDVGSTKKDLQDALEPLMASSGAVFVGSHPMCGSEQQGLAASRDNLYDGAVVAVIPARVNDPDALEKMTHFWKAVGALPAVMTAGQHDQWVARTSHLPHLLASLLVATVAREGVSDEICSLCGPGFADTSRVAEGAASVWHDIIKTNKSAIRQELDALAEKLNQLIQHLDADDFPAIESFLEQSRIDRIALMKNKLETPHDR